MCGFAGYRGRSLPQDEAEQVLRSMGDALAHRGPDDSGYWLGGSGTIGLSHRRLAVIDLSASGHQPMPSASGRHVIAYNGEIYNHQDLRRELEAEGKAPDWRGQSDTETLLAAIEAWGMRKALRRADGMFALALWDLAEGTLALARDRAGEKPLYYGRHGGTFLFGSDLDALRRHPDFRPEVDMEAAAHFLRLGYVPAPFSIYRGIKKLLPGHVLTIGKDNQELDEAYWSILDDAPAPLGPRSDDETLAELDGLLHRAVRGQMMADVPLGAFLSGGVDSSLVVALMQANATRPVKTFTIGFGRDDYNEAAHAKAVAGHLGTDHTELYVEPKDALAVVPRLPFIYSEPFADVSQIPTYLVSAMARQDVTVALSGDGGDELFGGYNRYAITAAQWGRLGRIPAGLRGTLGAMAGKVPIGVWDGIGRTLGAHRSHRQFGDKMHKGASALGSRSADDLYQRLIAGHRDPTGFLAQRPAHTPADPGPPGLAGLGDVERMMARDFLGYLPDDVLTKVDRAAMSVSLETRVPLLDHQVVEFAHRLPLSMKIRDGETKWALRRLLDRYVPRPLIERPKMGFAVPIGEWLRGPLRGWAEDLLDEGRLRGDGFLHAGAVRALWADHVAGRRNESRMLWSILMLQTWMESARGQPAAIRRQ